MHRIVLYRLCDRSTLAHNLLLYLSSNFYKELLSLLCLRLFPFHCALLSTVLLTLDFSCSLFLFSMAAVSLKIEIVVSSSDLIKGFYLCISTFSLIRKDLLVLLINLYRLKRHISLVYVKHSFNTEVHSEIHLLLHWKKVFYPSGRGLQHLIKLLLSFYGCLLTV